MKKFAFAAITLLYLSGCATSPHFNRAALEEASAQPGHPKEYTRADSVKEIDALKPQAELPLRLYVPQPANDNPWSQEEIEEIESWKPFLKQNGLVSELFVAPESTRKHCYQYDNCQLEEQRMEAARFQADAWLAFDINSSEEEYANPLSILNITLVGMWVVPAHHTSSDIRLEGSLVDVRNGYLYAFARAFGKASQTRPFMYSERYETRRLARLDALKNFGERLRQETSASAAPAL
ncbi:hypothetical protein HCH_00904 [Hahella chejuensis KCTC 2396]|uniref:Lipoprotein n=1 Tax=Hahella chejuensis (strain KCTC 2396) TaxID=349521 RepID=Q2SNH9_HAHCH|nr:hypothetical protein [Hahella chejuensis]ABC27795.1 hypothetical protein HCH_00904 [Hahella chejuensis KCTC 2396]